VTVGITGEDIGMNVFLDQTCAKRVVQLAAGIAVKAVGLRQQRKGGVRECPACDFVYQFRGKCSRSGKKNINLFQNVPSSVRNDCEVSDFPESEIVNLLYHILSLFSIPKQILFRNFSKFEKYLFIAVKIWYNDLNISIRKGERCVMKRVISFFLLFCIIFMTVILPICALDSENTAQVEEPSLSVLNNYTCEYNRQTGRVTLSGTVKHNALISHKQYRVEIYRVSLGETYESVVASQYANPIASAEIAARFEFSWSLSDFSDRFSRYAIVLCAPSGARSLAAPLFYASEGTFVGYDPSDRSDFKGIVTSETSLAGGLEMGTAIVPIDLGRLLQNTSYGYMYQMGDRTVYLDKSYIYEIDRTVRSYSATGTKVYLNLLIPSGDSQLSVASGKPMGASYDMPNVYASEVLASVCACCEFLAEHFSSYRNGLIGGVVVGASIDDPMMNYCGSLPLERYAEMYSLYMTAVSFSVRSYLPEAEVIIPFGDADVYASDAFFDGTYEPKQLLEQILTNLEDSLTTPLSCGTLIHFNSGKNTTGLSADHMSAYSAYLADLRARFSSAPTHYMAVWSVPSDMGSTALCANYAYAYYRLFKDPTLSSFVVSFLNCEADGSYRLDELKQILRWIDTEKSLSVTASLPAYFEKETWDELIDGASNLNYGTQVTLSSSVNEALDLPMVGSFSYFDFEGGHIEEWYAGSLVETLKSEYGKEGKRVLRADFMPASSREYGELLCLYEFPERFSHTPYLEFRMAFAEECGDQNGLYSVMITLGNDSVRTVAQTILGGKDIERVRISLDQFPSDQAVNYMKISIRQIEGNAQTVSFRLYDVIGYSPELSSEELAERIGADRMRARNLTEKSDRETTPYHLWIIGAVILIVAIMIVIFACLRKEDDSERSDASHDKNT
jgi:hypothetical protein